MPFPLLFGAPSRWSSLNSFGQFASCRGTSSPSSAAGFLLPLGRSLRCNTCSPPPTPLARVVVEGKDILPPKHTSASTAFYVTAEFGNQKRKTKTIKNSLEPSWGETFDLYVAPRANWQASRPVSSLPSLCCARGASRVRTPSPPSFPPLADLSPQSVPMPLISSPSHTNPTPICFDRYDVRPHAPLTRPGHVSFCRPYFFVTNLPHHPPPPGTHLSDCPLFPLIA